MNRTSVILFVVSLAYFIAAYINRTSQISSQNYLKLAAILFGVSVILFFIQAF
jgi:hypothetical protein